MLKICRFVAVLAIVFTFAAAARAQAPRAFPFRAANYNVEVLLHPDDQTIIAQAKVDFVANQVSKTVVVELHPDLKLSSVHVPGGKPLEFERDKNHPLILNVGLPESATPGKMVSLIFEYSGPVSSEEDSPTKGVRFASVEKTSAYLLLPARWFPLTNFPSNRYTGTFKLIVPESFAVVGTGKSEAPTVAPGIGKLAGQATYIFHCDEAAPVGSFVAGNLQLTPVQTEGISVSVYAPSAQKVSANAYGNSLARIAIYYSGVFGAMPSETFTIAQLPEGTVSGFSAPGLLLVAARQWFSKGNDRLLSLLAAQQWWGSRVLPASSSDVWLTDGLSSYAEAMYAEQSNGVAGLHKALEDFAVGALMYEDQAPISQANRLNTYSNEYRSVVADKGALIFHMLRTQLGDDAFNALLRDAYKKYEGKSISIDEFEKAAASKAPAPVKGQPPLNLTAFFSQWLNSTGIPQFKLEYIVYRTPKGFRIVGKVHQELDTFRMPVEVRVDTEGNPELKKILVTGTTSDFVVETFGRPKPNGITIDPNNNLLKSSNRLRVRASIARGEALAEQGKYYEAIKEYQRALNISPSSSLAQFRMAEAMFYQKNYQAAANAFRAALGGDQDPKWVEVWSHIYIGKIYDLLDQRTRAVNEYQLAEHTGDDTAGAQDEIARYKAKPYSEGGADAAATAPTDSTPAKQPAPAGGAGTPAAAAATPAPADATAENKPVLRKSPPQN